MTSDLPRGIRNNNPGNLRPLPNDRWRGEIAADTGATPDPSDEAGAYSRFSGPEWGVRAMIRDVRRKRGRGLTTVRSILAAYAPAGDNNDVDAYARRVCGIVSTLLQIHLEPNDPLPPDSRAFRVAFAKAQVVVENGAPAPFGRGEFWYPDMVYQAGAELEETP